MKHDAIFSRIHLLKQQPKQGMADQFSTNNAANKAEVDRIIKQLTESAENITSIGESYVQVVASLNKQNLALQTGISAISAVYDDFEKSLTATIKSATFLEQRNKTLNKSFGITSISAAKLGEAYDSLNTSLNVGGEQIRTYGININKILPGMSKMIAGVNAAAKNFKSGFNVQLLGTNQLLTEHIGLTGDAANNYQLYAAGAGKNSLVLLSATQKWADSFDEATGMAGTFSGVISDIADLGADIQTQYNKMPGSLEKSVIKAKLLGTTFKQIEIMASKMLNIEESVGAELEYQLLSGKRLVDLDGNSITEKLRIAKLSGNAEAQVEAMNDLLKSQGDIIDGNNYYAKEQLANLTGFTVAELTRQRQTQKLMEQGGFDKAKIDKYMSMDPTSFAEAITENESKSNQILLQQLKESAGQKTTDELYADMLQRERTEGIKVMLTGTNQTAAITGAKNEAAGSYGNAADFISQFGKPEFAKTIGHLQLMGSTIDSTLKPLETFAGYIPIVGSTLQSLINDVDAMSKKLFGQNRTSVTNNTTTAANDALLVNDAMIQFHPADKFATVSDGAALLASTERGKLDSAVNTLTGKNSGGVAVVDPAPIAAAIIASMRNMKVEVNYDVTAAASAANFKFNQGIN